METRSFRRALSIGVACLLFGACAGSPGTADPFDGGGGAGGSGGTGGTGGADVSLRPDGPGCGPGTAGEPGA